MSAFLSKLFTLFLSKIEKNAVFAVCCEISIRDGVDNKKYIRMLRRVRKRCPHAAPHRIQTQLSSRCTAPHHKLCILQISITIKKKLAL